MKKYPLLQNITHGFFIGISLISPGFSAATMAIILGIYEELISLLSDFFSPRIKRTIIPIIGLGIGAGGSILLLSRILGFTFSYFPYYTRFFFLGLIVATIPLMVKQSDVKKFKANHYLIVCIGVLLTFGLTFLPNFGQSYSTGQSVEILQYILLLLSGILVSTSMLLPGLSGALVLLLLGSYEFLLESISHFNIPVLLVFAIGVLLGFVISGKTIKKLLHTHTSMLFAFCLGLIIGSIPVMLAEGIPNSLLDFFVSLIFLIVGFFAVTALNRLKK